MRTPYEVVRARPKDLSHIPAIELAAARLLAGFAPESVLAETTPLHLLQEAQRAGRLWVARIDDIVVGYARVEVIDRKTAHLEEVDVHPSHGRRGVGTRLVSAICESIADSGFAALTLTTFRDAPWNMPFYARLGFAVVPHAQLTPALSAIVEDEARRGLDRTRRVVMRREF